MNTDSNHTDNHSADADNRARRGANGTSSRRLRNALVGAALATGILGTGAAAFAQTSTDQSTTPSTVSSTVATAPDAGGTNQSARPDRPGRPDPSELAAKLGVTTDQLTSAVDAARTAVDAQLGKPERPSTPPSTDAERQALQEKMKERHTLMDTKVAEQLGISVDQLTAARVSLAEEHINADVASGKLTQAQADEMLTHIRNGDVPPGPGGHHGPPPDGTQPPADGQQPPADGQQPPADGPVTNG